VQPARTEERLQAIAEEAAQGHQDGRFYVLPPPPDGFRLLRLEEASERADTCLRQIFTYSSEHIRRERTDDDTVLAGGGFDVPVDVWLQSIASARLRESDCPLYYILRDSIHPHTPHGILRRWAAMYYLMKEGGQTIESLTRRAEREPRKKWTPLVSFLYSLMRE
jgi:hypothetical protein